MNENLSEQFLGNGFIISNASLFDKELKATNMEPYDLLNKLLDLQKSANAGMNIVDFSKSIMEKINNFETILEDDEYYRKSDKDILEKVSKDIASINQKFNAINNYLIAESNMLTHKQYLLDAKKKLYMLDRNTTISDEKRTSEALKIRDEIKACQASYDEYYKICNEQKAIYNKSVQGVSVVDFKNDLLAAINTLEDDCRGLAISQVTKDKVSESIKDMRNETVYFALDSIKSKNEFNALCKRYGLIHDGRINNISQTEQKDNNKKQDNDKQLTEDGKNELDAAQKDVNPDYTGPVKDNEQLAVVPEPDKTKPQDPNYLGTVDPDKQIAVTEPKDLDINTPTKTQVNPTPSKEPEINEPNNEPKIKVVAKRACKWISDHKKQILIAIGISILIVAVIVALQYLIPAITTMLQTSQVASLSSAMMNNGALWHGAIASEQAALHGANTALASAIQSMTGSKAIFDVGTGIWSIGGAELSQFTTAAIANASSATSTAAAISKGVMGLGVAGLGLTGIGAILPKKSTAYKNILKSIKNLKKNLANMSHEEVQRKVAEIISQINKDTNLTDSEKARLTGKSNKLTDTSAKLVDTDVLEASAYPELNDEITELNKNLANMTDQDVKEAIASLIQKIKNTNSLTNEEKELLVKKTRKVFGNYKKLLSENNLEQSQEETQEQEQEQEEGRGR